jgi:iron uptake system component EfeO
MIALPSLRRGVVIFSLIGVGSLLTSCTDKADSGTTKGGNEPAKLTVTATDDACTVSAADAPSGTLTFAVTNKGSKVNEFYLFAEDGVRVVGEVENIGPGITRNLVVRIKPGTYVAACKPGMSGDGIRSDFTVTDSGEPVAAPAIETLLSDATEEYTAFVRREADELLEETEAFAGLYRDGKDDEARASYAPTRMHWERIEPVAESFGDVDPKLDLREADLEAGQEWTGWHRIEKDLWPPANDASYVPLTMVQRAALADQLVADTKDLRGRVSVVTLSPDQLSNGAKELLDEVATGKITGEEEVWSGTDLWDFQANVDGAKMAFEVLEPVLREKDPALLIELDERFDDVQKLLDAQKKGDGFVIYRDLSPEQIKAMADAVNALGEPLSRLTAAVVL